MALVEGLLDCGLTDCHCFFDRVPSFKNSLQAHVSKIRHEGFLRSFVRLFVRSLNLADGRDRDRAEGGVGALAHDAVPVLCSFVLLLFLLFLVLLLFVFLFFLFF